VAPGRRVDLEEHEVRALLREQHPDLAGAPLRRMPGGWDNRMWRLGDDLAVRLPMTERAPGLLRKEGRWLPVLAPRLPLPVPVPVRAGAPSARFPEPWAVTRWVPGEAADGAAVGGDAAGALAGFLRALHRAAPAEAPVGTHRGVAAAARTGGFEERLTAVTGAEKAARLMRVWDDAVTAPAWAGPPVWIHADLHPANVVVAAGWLRGVVDFGELCADDPATDLAAAWLVLPAGTAPSFFAAYAEADPATVRRARGWAVRQALSLIEVGDAGERGLPGGKVTWGHAGRAALESVLAAG
jgi:aminoglycoside phosphotransferase (APT) family kinase protein